MQITPAPVVVAVDDTGTSDDAVDWAAAEAAARRCPLRLVHCSFPALPLDPCGAPHPAGAGAELLAEAVDRVRRVAPDLPASALLLTAPIAPALIAEAERARLLVLGGRGRRRLLRRLVGSLPVRVAARAACPVVVIRSRTGGEEPPAPPRVVVGVDGGPSSAAAVGFAFRAARQRGVPLTALHAWTPDPPTDLDAAPAPPEVAEALARRALARAVDPWRDGFPDVAVRTELVRARPGPALVAGSRGAALLVVGGRARGPVRAGLLGPVGRAVLHRGGVPLAIVRHSGVLSPRAV